MSIYVIKLKGITGDKITTGHSIPDLGQAHVKFDVFTEICPKNSCYNNRTHIRHQPTSVVTLRTERTYHKIPVCKKLCRNVH